MSKTTKNLRKFRIRRQLSDFPEQQLKMIEEFIEFLRHRSNSTTASPIQLKGIWKNKGFERIKNLEDLIKEVRQELNQNIEKRPI